MQKVKRHILSTRPLPQALVDEALRSDIVIEETSFIETESLVDENLQKDLETFSKQPLVAVFTSMNAVEAVVHAIQEQVDWTVYSIGSATQRLVEEKLGVEVKKSAAYAAELAGKIIEDAPPAVHFFCGNIRRDLLPQKLIESGITVNEVVVYKTVETPKRVLKHFDAVLFYSPSAVESFFSVNSVDGSTQLFAIGTTTAEAIQQKGYRNVITATAPGKEELVQLAIRHFNKTK